MAKIASTQSKVENKDVNNASTTPTTTKDNKDVLIPVPKESKEPKTETKKDLKAVYAVLQAKYKLPDYDLLNSQFDIDTIETKEKYVAKDIAQKVFEQLENYRKIMESMLQPDMSIVTMEESEFLTEEMHAKILDYARQLMRIDRKLLAAELENTELRYAEFIIDANNTWQPMQKQFLVIVQHLEESWKLKRKGKQSQHYLG